MKTIDRDLDLLVRHEAGPWINRDHGDLAPLTRPPTRVLVAVDQEKRFLTREMQHAERDKLVSRLHESLPTGLRSKQSLAEILGSLPAGTWPSADADGQP